MSTPTQDGNRAGTEGAPLSDNPHPIGTPDWLDWQNGWIATHGRQLANEGHYGASVDDKTAVGLAPVPTRTGPRWQCRTLDEYPEPWRTAIRDKLFTPNFDKPGWCRWCGGGVHIPARERTTRYGDPGHQTRRAYKSTAALTRHERDCWKNPGSPRYTEHGQGFAVNEDGVMGAWWASDAARRNMTQVMTVLSEPLPTTTSVV